MFSGQTLLTKEIINKINEIDNENINILEIGGNDKNKNLFKNAKYYSLGYEADINIDLNADFTNKFDIQFDYIIISTTMMYMNNVNNFLLNSLSYMTKNSKIIIMEAFIYPQTNHKNIYDTNRLTYEFVINFLTSKNYQIIKAKRIGGIFSSILLLFIDLFPSIIKKIIGGGLIQIGKYFDLYSSKSSYFKKRHDKYYQGYIIEATKK